MQSLSHVAALTAILFPVLPLAQARPLPPRDALSTGLAVLEPPAQYSHRYRGPVIERVIPPNEARQICTRMGASADACSWNLKGKCYIVIPRDGPAPDLGSYRRHEIAHCNGWSHSRSPLSECSIRLIGR
jgi:hypothetical protein